MSKLKSGAYNPLHEKRLGIIIPVYNERENIVKTLQAIRQKVKTANVIYIVYDFIEDDTLPAARDFIASYGDMNVVFLHNNKEGALEAIKLGFAKATEPFLLVTMADMSDDYGDVDDMCTLMDEGYDIVCGSRYMKGGRQIGDNSIKKLMSKVACISLKYLAGIPTYDATNSFKLYRKALINQINIESNGGFELGLEIVVKAYFDGYKITEIPTVWYDRTEGHSRFKLIRWSPNYLRWYRYALRKAFFREF
ncbi:MAG: glycosyltransferase [Candidatus Magnetoovum sp. WYHC-5]|nr:glycosyltransferase [Candidatus Magnetoovum sp. WYHC-5]